MRAVEIVVMEVEREAGRAVVAGVVGAGISPLAGDGLDEAFGLAIGLGAVGSGEEVFEAQLVAGGGKEFGAISGSAIGEDALDGDVMGLVKSEGLLEGGQDAGSLFIWEEAGKSEAGMVINGDVQAFDAGPGIAVGTVAGGANAGLMKAAKLFNIKVKEFTWGGAFVTEGWRFGWFEGTEAVEAMAFEDAREGGFGDGENHEDLGIGAALPAEREDLVFELGRGFAGLVERP
jgi:hypothetical protein